MAPGRQRDWAWQWYTRNEDSIQCKICLKIFKCYKIRFGMKVHLRNKHQKFNDEDDRKWRERKGEYHSIWKYFTKRENYSAECKICATLIQQAVNNVPRHLTVRHPDIIAKERKNVVENISSRHFVIDENTDKAECIDCKRKLTIFVGIERLRRHTYQHKMKIIRSHTNMGRNSIDLIQQSTSEENNANTSSYQAGTHSEITENLEGEHSSISANNDDHIVTAMKIHSKDVCNTDNEERNEIEWILNAYIPSTILGHLKTMHIEEIAKEKREVMENTWLSRHFIIDLETEKAMCIHCTKMLSIFLGSESLRLHTYHHEMENITSYTNMGRNTIDMIQQSTSVKNNANTSFYQAGTNSESAENLEGERSSISANNGNEDFTEMDVECTAVLENWVLSL